MAPFGHSRRSRKPIHDEEVLIPSYYFRNDDEAIKMRFPILLLLLFGELEAFIIAHTVKLLLKKNYCVEKDSIFMCLFLSRVIITFPNFLVRGRKTFIMTLWMMHDPSFMLNVSQLVYHSFHYPDVVPHQVKIIFLRNTTKKWNGLFPRKYAAVCSLARVVWASSKERVNFNAIHIPSAQHL